MKILLIIVSIIAVAKATNEGFDCCEFRCERISLSLGLSLR